MQSIAKTIYQQKRAHQVHGIDPNVQVIDHVSLTASVKDALALKNVLNKMGVIATELDKPHGANVGVSVTVAYSKNRIYPVDFISSDYSLSKDELDNTWVMDKLPVKEQVYMPINRHFMKLATILNMDGEYVDVILLKSHQMRHKHQYFINERGAEWSQTLIDGQYTPYILLNNPSVYQNDSSFVNKEFPDETVNDYVLFDHIRFGRFGEVMK